MALSGKGRQSWRRGRRAAPVPRQRASILSGLWRPLPRPIKPFRPSRLVVVSIALFSMLFVQLVLASYACPEHSMSDCGPHCDAAGDQGECYG